MQDDAGFQFRHSPSLTGIDSCTAHVSAALADGIILLIRIAPRS